MSRCPYQQDREKTRAALAAMVTTRSDIPDSMVDAVLTLAAHSGKPVEDVLRFVRIRLGTKFEQLQKVAGISRADLSNKRKAKK